MNITMPRLIAAYIAGPVVAVGITFAAFAVVPAVAGTEAPGPVAVQQTQEDDPSWDWRTMGNTCRGLYGNGVLECVSDPGVDPELWALDGHWSFVDETSTWIFCPTGRSDIECGS